jgi:hypothetical protein
MADAFPLSGNVDPRTFPFAIMDLHRGGATGSLKVEGPTYHKALYFRSGRMLFGSSNDPRDQLGAILIESGKLTPEQLEDVNGKVGPGNPLAKLLSESGLVSQRELGDAARAKVERIVSDLLNYESGSYEFEDGVLPKGAVDLKLSTEKTAIAAVQRIEDRAFVLRHIDSLQTVLSPTPELAEGAASLEGELGSLPQCVDGQRTIKEVAEAAGMDDFETAKLACALLFLGWVQTGASAAGSGPIVVPDVAEAAPEFIADEEAPLFVSPDSGAEIDLGAAAESGFESGVDPALVIASPDDDATVAIPTPSFGSETPEGHGAFVPTDEETEVGDDELAPQFLPDAEAPEMSMEAEPADETQQDFGPPDEDLPSTGIFDQSYSPTMPSARAYADEASDVPTEIGLSLPPTPVEETGPPPPPPGEPETGSMPPQQRPSKEDLAALDALLNSRSLDSGLEPGRPDDGSRWEPQFLSGRAGGGAPPPTPTFGSPGATGRLRPAESTWAPWIKSVAAAVAVVAVAAAAAVYSLGGIGAVMAKLGFRTTEPTPAPPTTTLAPTPPPSTLVADSGAEPLPEGAPTPEGQATPMSDETLADASPEPDAGAPSPAAPSTTLPPPPATPTPPPATTPRPAAGGGVEGARAALRAGQFASAAAGFAAGLRNAGDFSVQVLVACSTETVSKAVRSVDAPELFIVPVELQGRACYRMCWGMYGSDREAQAGARGVPAYFREGGAKPRVVRTSEIIP